MVYMAADNDLDVASADVSINSMLKTGSNANVTVILQLDTRGTTARRYRVDKGHLTLLADLGEKNMADPAVLTDFIVAGQQAAPADHYALVLWDHGNGWQTGVDKRVMAAIEDWENGSVRTLPMANSQIAEALRSATVASGRKIDIIGVDACLMATMEVAYEFKDSADILVASQDLVQGFGWDYADLLGRMQVNPAMAPREAATAMVESYSRFAESPNWGYGDQTISAIALGARTEAIAREINNLAVALKTKLADPAVGPATAQEITSALAATQKLQPPTYVDLKDFVRHLDPLVSGSAVLEALSASIIAEYHGSKRPNANGLNIVFIDLPAAILYSVYDFDYTDVTPGSGRLTKSSFVRDYSWDEMMNAYFTVKYPDLVRK